MFFLTSAFWFSVIRSMTPVLLATLAIGIASKGGVYNLAVEGIMLICALTGVVVSAFTQSLFWGAVAGIAIGVAFSLLLGFFVMKMGGRSDHHGNCDQPGRQWEEQRLCFMRSQGIRRSALRSTARYSLRWRFHL